MDQQKRGGGGGGGGVGSGGEGGGGGGAVGGKGGGGGKGESLGGGGGTGIVSLSDFEAAISDEAVARHAYLDCLEAALPMSDAIYKRAGDASDYDEAASIVSAQKTIRTILAGIAKPISKADIRAGLDLMRRELQREQTDIGRQIQAAKDGAARQAAQLLDQEKAAFAGQDFALAKQMKEAREAAARDGERAVKELQVCRTENAWMTVCCRFINTWATDQTANEQQGGAARQRHTQSHARNQRAGLKVAASRCASSQSCRLSRRRLQSGGLLLGRHQDGRVHSGRGQSCRLRSRICQGCGVRRVASGRSVRH
jgi:hypothetical protein